MSVRNQRKSVFKNGVKQRWKIGHYSDFKFYHLTWKQVSHNPLKTHIPPNKSSVIFPVTAHWFQTKIRVVRAQCVIPLNSIIICFCMPRHFTLIMFYNNTTYNLTVRHHVVLLIIGQIVAHFDCYWNKKS